MYLKLGTSDVIVINSAKAQTDLLEKKGVSAIVLCWRAGADYVPRASTMIDLVVRLMIFRMDM